MWFIEKIKNFFSVFTFDEGVKLDLNLEDPIFDAISDWNLQKVKKLINEGVNLYKKWISWQTPLMTACIEWQKEIVKLLIENWAKINIKDQEWLTTLDWANE